MLGVQLIRHTCDLPDQRRSCLPVAGKLAGSEKNSGRSVPQQVEIIHFSQRRSGMGIGSALGGAGSPFRSSLRVFLHALSRTAKVFAEPPGLQLHLCPTLVALQRRPVIPL